MLICGPFQVLAIRWSYLWNWGGADINRALLWNSTVDALDSLSKNLSNIPKDCPWLKSNFWNVAMSVEKFLLGNLQGQLYQYLLGQWVVTKVFEKYLRSSSFLVRLKTGDLQLLKKWTPHRSFSWKIPIHMKNVPDS